MVSPMVMSSIPGQADDVAGRSLRDLHPLEAAEDVELRDPGPLDRAVQLRDRDRVAFRDPAVDDASDGDSPQVVAGIEVGDQQLQRGVRIAGRGRHLLGDGVEQGPQVAPRLGRVGTGGARLGIGVQHREINLGVGGVEVDEQVVDLVEHLGRPRVRPVHLVDHHDRRQPPLQRLAQHEAGLRKGSLTGVDEQQHPVDHRQGALDLAAEVGVARRVDDVDDQVAVADGRVLGHDRDAALALQVDVVERALLHPLVLVEHAALVQQGVDQRGLAVVHVGDDRDIAAEGIGDAGGRAHGTRRPDEAITSSLSHAAGWRARVGELE